MQDVNAQVSASLNSLMSEYNVITHNLANVNTTGYKRLCNKFSRLLEANKNHDVGSSQANSLMKTAFDFSQGNLIRTSRPLDFALLGKGFFVIETPDGPLYTRNGSFHINQSNQVVNSVGHTVAGQNGPIIVPPSVSPMQLHVSDDGNVSANGINIGKLQIVDWQENEKKLISCGNCCFRTSDKNIEPEPATQVVVKQKYKEGSNVEMMEELVDMLMVARLYEANMKLIGSKKDTGNSLMNVAMG